MGLRSKMLGKRFFAISTAMLISLVSFESASAAARMIKCYDSEAEARAWGDEKIAESKVFFKNVAALREFFENPDTTFEALIDKFGKPENYENFAAIRELAAVPNLSLENVLERLEDPNSFENYAVIRKLVDNSNGSLENIIYELRNPDKKGNERNMRFYWFLPKESSSELIGAYKVRVIDNGYCAVAGVANLYSSVSIRVDVHGNVTHRQYHGEQAL